MHFILDFWYNLAFLCSVVAWTGVRIELLCYGSIFASVEWGGGISLVIELRRIVLVVDTWTNSGRRWNFPKFSLPVSSLQIDSHFD